jgi:hypothetical protein
MELEQPIDACKVGHEYEFTTVRRESDNWLLGTVHYSKAVGGYLITMFYPVGAYDGETYDTEAEAVAAICRAQLHAEG